MRILITGNLGYVGPSVVRELRTRFPDAFLHGFDNAYFAHCLTGAQIVPERLLDQQSFGDVRALTPEALTGYDAVVQLAAVSNDPMGNAFAAVTGQINRDSSIEIAKMAAQAGVSHYVFASSCSVYGVADGAARREDDPLNPITAYAQSKIETEQALAQMDTQMVISCLRFATACGMAPRLRLDLVLNDFVACALSARAITVLSDGTPWRPLIDTKDMARAIAWAVARPADNGGRYLTVNVGSDDRNYQVRELAERVAAAVPGTEVSINLSAPADSRSYKVDFARFAALAPDHQPIMTLDDSIAELVDGLGAMGFADADFRNGDLIRLKVLQGHLATGRLSAALNWQ